MTILWNSDCCQCILEMNVRAQSPTFEYVDWIQKCFIHKDFDNQPLVNQAVNQCRFYQLTVQNPTAQEKLDNRNAKATERARILALGDPIVNTN